MQFRSRSHQSVSLAFQNELPRGELAQEIGSAAEQQSKRSPVIMRDHIQREASWRAAALCWEAQNWTPCRRMSTSVSGSSPNVDDASDRIIASSASTGTGRTPFLGST